MKNLRKIGLMLCLLTAAAFTSGCLVINVEKNESPKNHPHGKEVNVEEVTEHAH
jgi:hypothetical protein